ncbi:tyrosine-type recombinase/integrase [Actinacidiphila soli]|uniref:tyrosine-type recombinase/integrase n=1 Tax=Actinacidiphila soli TaxID=2487275 RepID=UPI001F0BDAEF|nr:tyrosine-type recombinase/integrase [Actinacidiphila soli]
MAQRPPFLAEASPARNGGTTQEVRRGAARSVGQPVDGSGSDPAAKAHLPGWGEKLTPHVLRHFCASQLYGNGLDLLAIQEVLGRSWIATTMRYIHVQQTRVEDAWAAGMERAAKRLEGLVR